MHYEAVFHNSYQTQRTYKYIKKTISIKRYMYTNAFLVMKNWYVLFWGEKRRYRFW